MSGYDASSPPAGSRRSGGTCEPAHETSTVKAPDPNRSRELRVLQRARFSRREDLKAEMQIVFDTPTRRSKPTKRRLPAVIEPERSSKRPRRPSREEQLAEMAPFHPGSAAAAAPAAAAHAPADPITLAQRAAAAVTPFYWVVAAECAHHLGLPGRRHRRPRQWQRQWQRPTPRRRRGLSLMEVQWQCPTPRRRRGLSLMEVQLATTRCNTRVVAAGGEQEAPRSCSALVVTHVALVARSETETSVCVHKLRSCHSTTRRAPA